MKTATIHTRNIRTNIARRYPNAATRREVMNKVLDNLLIGAIGAGAAASLLFVMLLF